ncbi:MAG: FAD-dependent oxidoreductase [Proteobacteria bacterium]|nr:FAD-dependent oxidoreductase [Pseudomonadota bacterium]
MTAYPSLFSSLRIGQRQVRNRVALPATLTNFGLGNRITEKWRNFLVERAKGGAGLIVSEIIAVDPEALAHGAVVTGFDDGNDAGFKQVAQGVHAAGALLVGQLWHPGRQQLWHPTKSPMGVSEQPDALSWTVPHVMSGAEIARVAAAYIAVAQRLRRCGFAGIELHGAHGYLIGQFLSPWSNTRNDVYGGGVEGRTRFVRDIADGIRHACGAEFIIGLKMPGDEGVPGGIDVEEAARLTGYLAQTGNFDYFAHGQGNFSLSLENHVPDLHFRPGHFIDIPKRMRAAANGIPVMALGRIGDPDLAEKIVAEGYGDLVGMTRAHIADAAWARKAAAGRRADIRPSVFDNWCWGEIHAGKPLAEHHNPYLGLAGEAGAEQDLAPATTTHTIAVIGAGPAGLEAAWVAAARGHRVTVFGASDQVGGKLRLDSELPGRGEMAKLIDYQRHMCERHGVRFILGRRSAAKDVLALGPDAIVLATGASLRQPMNLAAGADAVVDAIAYLRETAGREASPGGTAVLFDQDHGPATYGLADLLARRFDKLILITPRPGIAQNVNYCSAIGVHRRLHQAGVDILPAHELIDYRGGDVICRNVFTETKKTLGGIAKVVFVTPRLADDSLAKGDAAGAFGEIPVHRIGDCLSPRNIMAAIHGGHLVGAAL